eukprot:CAMPEP_0197645026 /NCGR_PEP_ID=MMETSP1338-20131121/17813_1 /TAXON_ID=43686 ORGANISM="Pelagodinium beii, Strain RCC1491" /NCGR_SAMPLE_ID=MMETSP1338 /ASSEMBLY_ACC=CAM_ASM_000754 /LENGTH=55 /DNA_ID=CAMNT_0043218517 /DNA_START=104 /DNA_END=268 /DNA_ORIENTATION=+
MAATQGIFSVSLRHFSNAGLRPDVFPRRLFLGAASCGGARVELLVGGAEEDEAEL